MTSTFRSEIIKQVTLIGLVVNLVLTAGKIVAGVWGKSSAMVADGVHSLSDFATDIIVLIFIRLSSRKIDSSHQYGHGKFETFATMLISFALIFVGIGVLWSGSKSVYNSFNGIELEQPKIIALYAALISIIVKEGLYWYTKIYGEKVNSQTMIANAWHHRSDAFSSIGTSLGISGAIFLGERWRILDPIAGIVVSFFIIKVGWAIASQSVGELLERSLPDSELNIIAQIIENIRGVKGFHNLKTRKIGDINAIEVHILVAKELSVETSHEIASEIEKSLRNKFGCETHVGIHIEPYLEKNIGKY